MLSNITRALAQHNLKPFPKDLQMPSQKTPKYPKIAFQRAFNTPYKVLIRPLWILMEPLIAVQPPMAVQLLYPRGGGYLGTKASGGLIVPR